MAQPKDSPRALALLRGRSILYQLEHPLLHLGRARSCDITIRCAGISRFHAVFDLTGLQQLDHGRQYAFMVKIRPLIALLLVIATGMRALPATGLASFEASQPLTKVMWVYPVKMRVFCRKGRGPASDCGVANGRVDRKAFVKDLASLNGRAD